MDLPAEDAILTLISFKDKEMDDRLYFQWCQYAQLEVNFSEFKRKQKPKAHRSAKSIMKDVYGYIEMFNQGYTKVEI